MIMIANKPHVRLLKLWARLHQCAAGMTSGKSHNCENIFFICKSKVRLVLTEDLIVNQESHVSHENKSQK